MIDHPRLGFGCASLGSRVSERDGLAALERAFDAGIRWFDVAPSYGDGRAEVLLGRFLRGRRAEVVICTKVGIQPPTPSLAKRALMPVVRAALAVAPGLRQAVKRHRPPPVKPPLTAAMIGTSLEQSLRRLGVEQVDILALHAARPDEVVRDDVLDALTATRAAGKVARFSIASGAASVRAGLAASPLYGVVQVANNPLEPELAEIGSALPADRPIETVTHTVFGAAGMIETIAAAIAARPELAAGFRAAGYAGEPRAIARDFLPDFAFAANPDGVVLLSMFGAGHLRANLARHAAPRDPAAIGRLAAQLRAVV